MPDIVCTCIYEAYIDEPMSIWTTVLDFAFSAIIAVVAININYKFLKDLQEEKLLIMCTEACPAWGAEEAYAPSANK